MLISSPLRTDRLVLRCLSPEKDVSEAYLSWLTDPLVTRYLEIRHAQSTPESVRRYISSMNESNINLLMGMFLDEGERHIGNIKLGPIYPHHKRSDLGLFIGERSVWGQGLAVEAIRAMADYAHNSLGLHRISASCYSDNKSSLKTFLKSGFTQETHLKDFFLLDGRWQDCIYMYSLSTDRDE